VALITFMVSHPSYVDVYPLKRKELRKLHHRLLVLIGDDFIPYLDIYFASCVPYCFPFTNLHLVALCELASKDLKFVLVRIHTPF
jgi:hypothetical protein